MVRKALVDLKGPAFRAYAAKRASWALTDAYRCGLLAICKTERIQWRKISVFWIPACHKRASGAL